jgi:MYXO-CTERM domain-containing protein
MARVSWSGVLATLGVVAAAGSAEAAPAPKLDVLVLVDNSNSMGEEQSAFNQAFPRFIEGLIGANTGDPLPDLHIGVISSNMGAGGHNIQSCGGAGDDGALQASPRLAGCTAPFPERFIKDEVGPDGMTRVQNYSGPLQDTLACIATLGIGGCGFEQQLASVRRALDPAQVMNAGFLRDDAALAIVIISDEDDCSASDPLIFSDSPGNETTLGPLSSFRCTEFGVRCDGANIARGPGSYTTCEPRTDSYLSDPLATAAYIKSLKSDPGQVVVAVINAPTSPFTVAADAEGRPRLEPSCTSGFGSAAPGVRLQAFAQAFPARHFIGTICNDGYGDYMAAFGSLARSVIKGTAPPVPPATPDAGPSAPDAGPPAVDPMDEGGCGCAVGAARSAGGLGAGLAGLAGLAVLAVLRPRRRA